MTLGEKIREARKQAGLSQQQLSEKLSVSRSAVAKWEAGNGMPDIDNLKALAGFLHVRMESMLDDGEETGALVMREPYSLPECGRGGKSALKDRAVRDRFPDAQIHPLLGEKKLTKSEKLVDNALGFLTDAPFGIPGLIQSLKHMDQAFYLVEVDGRQFLVTVTDEWMEIRPLAKRMIGNRFEIGDWKFTRCAHAIKP